MSGYTKVKKKLDNGVTVRISDGLSGYVIGIKNKNQKSYMDMAHYFDWDVAVKKYKEIVIWAGEMDK